MIPRRFHHFIVLSFVLVLAGRAPASAADPLDAVRARFAPDRRLVLFDVTVERQDDAVVVKGEVESTAARDAAVAAVRASGATRVDDRIVVLPAASLGAETHGVVRVSVANVRGKPAQSAEMVTQAVMGWPVRVLKEQSGWYLVHTEPDGYLGWIEDLQIARMTVDARRAWDASPLGIVTTPVGFLRDSPGASADPVSDVVIGALVRAEAPVDGWARATLPDGRVGFLPAADVQPLAAFRTSRAPSAAAFESTARLFLGVPYLWGGTSAKGFDCSGFVKTVLRMNGIEMPRDTDQQAEAGEPVPLDADLSALRPGDLLFFGTPATADRRERISHVGLHVGGLQVIHASGLVRRNSLDPASPIYSESLRTRLLRARRILPSPRATD